MIIATGMHSRKVYAKGKDKAEVCRCLDGKYVNKKGKDLNGFRYPSVYPEPLMFERR